MSTTEKPAETPYQPGDTIALNVPREPDRGTRLQDESGYVCENVGPDENGRIDAHWLWEDKTGKQILPHMTWMEVLSEATGALTILPPPLKAGDTITDRDQLDLLPNGTVVLNGNKDACQKESARRWYVQGLFVPVISSELDPPLTILWIPENEEQE